MRYDTPAEQILRTQEAAEEQNHQHEGKDRGTVRKIATAVLQELGYNNAVEDIKLDNKTWQIDFGGYLSHEEQTAVEDLVSEQLKTQDYKINSVKLVGFCHP